MSDDIPTSYDVIVLGTGMVESIVAAAVARTGKSVLHLDSNNFYGQLWATLSLDSFEQWVQSVTDKKPRNKCFSKDKLAPEERNYRFYETQDERDAFSDVSFKWNIVEEAPEPEEAKDESQDGDKEKPKNYTIKKVRELSRKFNIDLAPKLLFAKGPMVEILIKSQVSKYLEFVNVSNILIYLDNVIESVPCSKSDVFSSKSVGMVDKRHLMKVLTGIQSYTEESTLFKDFEEKTFMDYLKANLPEKFATSILYSIAACDKDTPCIEGVKKAKKFLSCLGFYGNSPFIFPLYGSSELLQGFCRQCAVFNGIYCLNRGAEVLAVDENGTYVGCVSNGVMLKSKHLVVTEGLLPEVFRKVDGSAKRAILITDRTIFPEGKEGMSLLQYPTDTSAATLVELSGKTYSAPKGLYLVQVVGDCLEEAIGELFSSVDEDSKPRILYQVHYTLNFLNQTGQLPTNVHPSPGPNFATDFDSEIVRAEEIFQAICPGEEFFSPLPAEPTFEGDHADEETPID